MSDEAKAGDVGKGEALGFGEAKADGVRCRRKEETYGIANDFEAALPVRSRSNREEIKKGAHERMGKRGRSCLP